MPLSQIERERVIETLCTHYANDHLSTEELEALIERAYRANSAAELVVLTSNLPALREADVTPTRGTRALAARADEIQDSKRTLSFMSETVRQGSWIPARRNNVFAFMSSVTLDLREAVLAPGQTEFELNAFMAEINVIVPPGLAVSSEGHAIMAEFKDYTSSSEGGASAPTVLINGTACMASVEVHVRLPGESARNAKKRIKAEKRRG